MDSLEPKLDTNNFQLYGFNNFYEYDIELYSMAWKLWSIASLT